jgi:tetratricopeptide (TPR) repeat protein
MNIIESIQAEMFLNYYLHRGKLQLSEGEALRHYKKALEAIEEEVKKRPNDLVLITKCADIINKVEKATFRINKQKGVNNISLNNNLTRAKDYYVRALKLKPEDTNLLAEFAQFLYFWGEVSGAEENYLNALEVDPNHLVALQNYGKMLLNQSKKIGNSFLTRYAHVSGQQSVIESFMHKNVSASQAVDKLNQFNIEYKQLIKSLDTSKVRSVLRSTSNYVDEK